VPYLYNKDEIAMTNKVVQPGVSKYLSSWHDDFNH
jgi:hypothetical protein